MAPTPVCSAKLLTFRTKTTFQILLYMVLCHQSAQHSVPDDYSLQDIVSEEYSPSILFCSSNQLVPSDQMDMFVRLAYLKHSCVTLVTYQPSLAYLKPWHHVMSGAIYATLLGSTPMLPLSRRRAKKKKSTRQWLTLTDAHSSCTWSWHVIILARIHCRTTSSLCGVMVSTGSGDCIVGYRTLRPQDTSASKHSGTLRHRSQDTSTPKMWYETLRQECRDRG